jgi:hypothetical protein
MGRSTLQTLPPTRPGCSRLPDARHRRRPGGVGAEPPTCFRDSEHTGPCRTRGRGAEPPGAQRQPNLPHTPARCALLLDVSQLNLQYQPARYVLLINPVPNLPNNPARYVLLLKVSQPNLQYKPTGHVLLLSVQPAKSCTSSHRLCAPLMCSSYVLLLCAPLMCSSPS